jgi:carboxylate-amine ligase
MRPDWARWRADPDLPLWTVGVEEEVMLLDPRDWSAAQVADRVLPALSRRLAARVSAETHAAALELATAPHETVAEAIAELAGLRGILAQELAVHGCRAAVAGTHPSTTGEETRTPQRERQQLVLESMRALARREPTYALHVHVAVPEAELAVSVANRMRAHLPVLLALSANSPFWQGRDTGFASMRTPLFGGFPRSGMPRAFAGYDDWVHTVETLIASGAFPEPTFLWWDVRLQPRIGTIEVRIMDAQTSLRDVAALVALVQALVRLEAEEGFADPDLVASPEVLEENRFLAARDGMRARLLDPVGRRRVPVADVLSELVGAARPYGAPELALVAELAAAPGADRQRALAGCREGLQGVVRAASAGFTAPAGATASAHAAG